MLLRLRLRGSEKDPRLVAVLAALVWVRALSKRTREDRLVGLYARRNAGPERDGHSNNEHHA